MTKANAENSHYFTHDTCTNKRFDITVDKMKLTEAGQDWATLWQKVPFCAPYPLKFFVATVSAAWKNDVSKAANHAGV
jgi:hypothetical protein